MSVAVRVIPCLDVDAGRVVKGVNFENLRDAGDPVELAAKYGAQGADELTFLDVTASSSDRSTTYDVVSRTAEQVFIPLTVGGGVRTVDDVDRLLRAGADKVGINTGAIARPEVIGEIADRAGRKGDWTRERVVELLPRLGERLRNRGDQLSGGEQQMLAIARALLTNPTILLLDEPSDGLAPSVVHQVADVVREVCGAGMSVLIVEQNLRLALSVADRVVVMQKGSVRWDVPVEEFRRNRARAEELLGI